jgi:tRNA(Ile)-lysidine synthase
MLDKLAGFAEKYDMFPTAGLVLSAVSGGADSVCLLAALFLLSARYGFTVAAVHFNHRLRGEESDRDALFVERFCRERNIECFTGCGDVAAYAKQNGLGIEEAAREMRYAFFHKTAEKTNAARIATAHTADDNAETVIFHLARGTGLRGLTGIPPVRGILIRPMLCVTRNEVVKFLAERSLAYVEDSSNSSDVYTRNKIRHHVIPVLREINPRAAENISAASALLREDDAYLDGLAEEFIRNRCLLGTAVAAELLQLPKPLSGRVIRKFCGELSSRHVAAVLELCGKDSPSDSVTLPSCLVYREYDRIVFSREQCLNGFASRALEPGIRVSIPELGLCISCVKKVCTTKINKSFTSFLFKNDNICGKIVIRPRLTGDKIALSGGNGTKSLKKLFIEKRIPLRKRPIVPVFADSNGVLAIYGIGADKRVSPDIGDDVLEIIIEETDRNEK